MDAEDEFLSKVTTTEGTGEPGPEWLLVGLNEEFEDFFLGDVVTLTGIGVPEGVVALRT